MSVLRTIELCLGMKPLFAYDATAVPLYAAFGMTKHVQPFDAIAPRIDINAKNKKTAYGERRSELANFAAPDAVAPAVLTDILAHNRAVTPR